MSSPLAHTDCISRVVWLAIRSIPREHRRDAMQEAERACLEGRSPRAAVLTYNRTETKHRPERLFEAARAGQLVAHPR